MNREHVPPEALVRLLNRLQDLGLSPSIAERFLSWWKRFGFRNAAILILAVTLPLWRYVWIPSSLSSGFATVAESYGADVRIGDWTSDWGNIRVTAEDVTWTVRGPYTEERLLVADALELDWSLWRGVRNAAGRVASLFGEPRPDEPVHTLRLSRATLHLERLLSGRWNWQDAISLNSVSVQTPLRVPSLYIDDLRLVWMEHLPGDSGGGLIERKTASLFLDDVRASFSDIVVDDQLRGVRFTAEGRTADGRFSATGEFGTSAPQSNVRRVSDRTSLAAEAPALGISIYLENVGAAAFARIISDASLLPTSGTMTGRIGLNIATGGRMDCEIDLQLRNVQYAPNPRSSYVRARQQQVVTELAQFTSNEHVSRRCSAEISQPEVRVTKALQAEITGEAVKTAPPLVQGAAGYDQLRFVQADERAMQGYSPDVTEKIAELIGGERGAMVARALTATREGTVDDRTLGRGLRSVGRQIKKLFGGK